MNFEVLIATSLADGILLLVKFSLCSLHKVGRWDLMLDKFVRQLYCILGPRFFIPILVLLFAWAPWHVKAPHWAQNIALGSIIAHGDVVSLSLAVVTVALVVLDWNVLSVLASKIIPHCVLPWSHVLRRLQQIMIRLFIFQQLMPNFHLIKHIFVLLPGHVPSESWRRLSWRCRKSIKQPSSWEGFSILFSTVFGGWLRRCPIVTSRLFVLECYRWRILTVPCSFFEIVGWSRLFKLICQQFLFHWQGFQVLLQLHFFKIYLVFLFKLPVYHFGDVVWLERSSRIFKAFALRCIPTEIVGFLLTAQSWWLAPLFASVCFFLLWLPFHLAAWRGALVPRSLQGFFETFNRLQVSFKVLGLKISSTPIVHLSWTLWPIVLNVFIYAFSRWFFWLSLITLVLVGGKILKSWVLVVELHPPLLIYVRHVLVVAVKYYQYRVKLTRNYSDRIAQGAGRSACLPLLGTSPSICCPSTEF